MEDKSPPLRPAISGTQPSDVASATEPAIRVPSDRTRRRICNIGYPAIGHHRQTCYFRLGRRLDGGAPCPSVKETGKFRSENPQLSGLKCRQF